MKDFKNSVNVSYELCVITEMEFYILNLTNAMTLSSLSASI